MLTTGPTCLAWKENGKRNILYVGNFEVLHNGKTLGFLTGVFLNSKP